MDERAPRIDVTQEHSLDLVRFIREEIHFQHSLLATRISWLLGSEAFLFTAFALSRGSASQAELHWLWHWVIPTVAGLVAALTIAPVYGAVRRIRRQRELLGFFDLSKALPMDDHWDRFGHRAGVSLAIFAPSILLVAWGVVFVLTI
jgi:hypothetical protein